MLIKVLNQPCSSQCFTHNQDESLLLPPTAITRLSEFCVSNVRAALQQRSVSLQRQVS